MTKRFEVGRTYATPSITDHECVFSFMILGRSQQTVTVKIDGKVVRRGVKEFNGSEYFRPFGNYSMAAVIDAKDLVEAAA
jgi:hypothetical protein